MKSAGGVANPTTGLNDNINFLGKELHVQTENVPSTVPYIRTQVFFRGRVIYTAKHELAPDTDGWNDFNKIRELMNAQHLKVIDKISRQKAKYQNKPEP